MTKDKLKLPLDKKMESRKPPTPTWDLEPKHGLRFAVTGLLRSWILRARSQWFGVSPLRRHIVICGFPRSGTSLLQLMAETATSDARVFGTETRALKIARRCICKNSTLITKRTNDIFYVDELRTFYQGTSARPRFVVMIRDPRDVLTSVHASRPEDYYLSCDRWLALYEHYRYVRPCEDVFVVRYEDLVTDCEAVQTRLRDFAGLKTGRSFKDFTEAVPEGFLTIGLNGIRPPDTQSVGRWRQPQHRERLQSILASLPELPLYLIDMNYEADTGWVNEYVAADASQQQPASN